MIIGFKYSYTSSFVIFVDHSPPRECLFYSVQGIFAFCFISSALSLVPKLKVFMPDLVDKNKTLLHLFVVFVCPSQIIHCVVSFDNDTSYESLKPCTQLVFISEFRTYCHGQ